MAGKTVAKGLKARRNAKKLAEKEVGKHLDESKPTVTKKLSKSDLAYQLALLTPAEQKELVKAANHYREFITVVTKKEEDDLDKIEDEMFSSLEEPEDLIKDN